MGARAGAPLASISSPTRSATCRISPHVNQRPSNSPAGREDSRCNAWATSPDSGCAACCSGFTARLTTRACPAIEEAERVLVSAISVWEVAMLVAKRCIRLDRPVEQRVDIALALPGIQLAPLEPAIAVRSTKLPGEFLPDPADRIIVATALEHGVPFVTPDERIRSYPHVESSS
jgi:PIN domain nuclease of toxin-antitoxin system